MVQLAVVRGCLVRRLQARGRDGAGLPFWSPKADSILVRHRRIGFRERGVPKAVGNDPLGGGGEPEKREIERPNPIWFGVCHLQKRLSSLDLSRFRRLPGDLTIRRRRIESLVGDLP